MIFVYVQYDSKALGGLVYTQSEQRASMGAEGIYPWGHLSGNYRNNSRTIDTVMQSQ